MRDKIRELLDRFGYWRHTREVCPREEYSPGKYSGFDCSGRKYCTSTHYRVER